MGKFNTITKFFNKTKTTNNLAGGEAYALNPKFELVSILLTSFLGNSFYRSGDETLKKLVSLINKIDDKKFIAKAGIFARDKYGMRSVSHVLAGEIAKNVKGETWTKNFFNKIVVRVDDMNEILAYYLENIDKNKNPKDNKVKSLRPIPNSLKKGFREAFNRFDKYQLAKYKSENKSVKLIDIVNLIKPKPNEKNAEALKELVNGELKATETWESKLSQAGKNAENEEEKLELKAEAWRELILSRKIGYFALLRNLRNIILQVPDITNQVCELLEDEKLIVKSRVLPFRYTTAFSEIEKLEPSKELRQVLSSISNAVEISLKNVPVFDGKTLIVIDVSGSMSGKPAEIASLFGAVLAKANENAEILLFDTSTQFKNINAKDTVISISKSLRFNGGGTDFNCIFKALKKAYDRIIILSDMQGWVGYNAPTQVFNEYKKKYTCNPFIYSFDLAGYGTTQFPESKILCLYGFSDKIFETMKFFEQDRDILIKEIESFVDF